MKKFSKAIYFFLFREHYYRRFQETIKQFSQSAHVLENGFSGGILVLFPEILYFYSLTSNSTHQTRSQHASKAQICGTAPQLPEKARNFLKRINLTISLKLCYFSSNKASTFSYRMSVVELSSSVHSPRSLQLHVLLKAPNGQDNI